MHRVELKAAYGMGDKPAGHVPNAPCGVESLNHPSFPQGTPCGFLMHRVELKGILGILLYAYGLSS